MSTVTLLGLAILCIHHGNELKPYNAFYINQMDYI
jgi:hypothetical protein